LRDSRNNIEKALQARGLRSTTQRRLVMAFLLKNRGHATADEIFAAVNRAHPRASRATIYNNLRDLVQAQLVREVVADGRAARYDAVIERHHHFACDRCGRLEDIAWFELPEVSRRRGALSGRKLRAYELLLRGVCKACTTRSRD
jgi:Fur family peroxide stress response transcriptional regulator